MDILNKLPQKQFEAADDLLAFISIYDDTKRTAAYKKMIRDHISKVKGKVCVEAGAGLGIMSEYLAQAGAKKVYAVEVNPHLYKICRKRLAKYKNVIVVKADIRDFKPKEKIDLLLHELFGQLLLDEDLHVLHKLQFKPAVVMPDSGALKYGAIPLKKTGDKLITEEILDQLKGVLVSGLLEAGKYKPENTIVKWNYNKPFPTQAIVKLKRKEKELLFMGIEIHHNNKLICRSEECDNWAYAWTPIVSSSFRFDFGNRNNRLMEPIFKWL